VTVYIKEAHPTDEWQMSSNEKEGVCYPQPKSLEDRVAIARNFVDAFGYSLPMYVDDVTNAADELYAGWPERLYVIDEQGKIAYKGKTGPFGYEPDEVEEWFAGRCGR
jgi:hypothetical protein